MSMTDDREADVPANQPASLQTANHRPRASGQMSWSSLYFHLLLAVGGLLMALPFVWMVLTGLKPLSEVGLENWIPENFNWKNFLTVFEVVPFAQYYWNSLFVAAWVTFLQVFTSSLAAFSFSRLQWPGRDKVFLLYLSTLMLPGLVVVITNYQIMIHLGLVDTIIGLILPSAFTAFGTFLLRQFMLTIPSSLDEAAEIDGASRWRIYLDVILPLCRPGLIALTIFTFVNNYQSFFWPLVMMRTQDKYTLPIGLLFFDSEVGQATHLLMAAVTMSIFPMLLIFVFLQKFLISGIQLGGVKG